MIVLLVSLALLFGELSLLAFGGGITILPEMQRRVVEVEHWMTAAEFNSLFALAQSAPGPNMMIVPLIGWHLAGFPGLIVTSAAKFVPSSLITCFAYKLWQKHQDRPWRKIAQNGLVPLTAGLICASAAVITGATATNLVLAVIVGLSAVLAIFTRLHPLIMLAGGAVLGLAI